MSGRPTFDPFFDGGGAMSQPAAGAPVVVDPTANRYRDPSQVTVQLGGERTVASVIPRGQAGPGVIIPHAFDGVPAGGRPHAVEDMVINIDPQIEGQGSTIPLRAINAQVLRDAAQVVRGHVPAVVDIPTQRFAAAAVMMEAAQTIARDRGPAPATTGASTINAPLLGRFGVAAPAQRPSGPPLPDQQQEPGMEATFEIERFGQHRAVYHQIIVNPAFIVLVYREGYRGSRYFPPSAADAPQMAVVVTGQNQVHLVQSTGVVYSHGGWEYCMLLVEKSSPLDEAP